MKKTGSKQATAKKPAPKKKPPTKPAAPKSELTGVARVGELAGEVWHFLNKGNEPTLTQLAKEIDAPRDQVMQAVGWLAREGKLDIQDSGRNKSISLI